MINRTDQIGTRELWTTTRKEQKGRGGTRFDRIIFGERAGKRSSRNAQGQRYILIHKERHFYPRWILSYISANNPVEIEQSDTWCIPSFNSIPKSALMPIVAQWTDSPKFQPSIKSPSRLETFITRHYLKCWKGKARSTYNIPDSGNERRKRNLRGVGLVKSLEVKSGPRNVINTRPV